MDATSELLQIHTADGERLGAELLAPRGRVVGTAVFAHPMFANRSVFSRPRGRGVARLFCEAGWRTLAFDFRGHGESTAGGDRKRRALRWGYDDLVRVDLPTVVLAARARWPESRLVVVGHSLGGHVALAAQGSGAIAADALVVAATNVWLRRFEPSRRVWLVKLGVVSAMRALAARHGSFPARALRLGSDDESDAFIRDLARFARSGRWGSRDGAVDYAAALAGVAIPVFSLTSSGDRLYCRPASASAMLAGLAVVTEHCDRGEDGRAPPGHVGLVTSREAEPSWRRVLSWLDGAAAL